MRQDIFTDDELAYMYGFKPAGFLRTWHALYESKCIAGPWTLSRSRLWFGGLLYGAIERGNRWPNVGRTRIEPNIIGWHVYVPLGIGTFALWGYRRNQP